MFTTSANFQHLTNRQKLALIDAIIFINIHPSIHAHPATLRSLSRRGILEVVADGNYQLTDAAIVALESNMGSDSGNAIPSSLVATWENWRFDTDVISAAVKRYYARLENES
jgi:hypothetical protein